MINYMISIW